MRKICLLIVGLLVVSSVNSSFGFWVKRNNKSATPAAYVQADYTSFDYGPNSSADSNYGVWVELPDFNLGIMQGITAAPAPAPQSSTPEQSMQQEKTVQEQQAQVERPMFTQFSDVSSDIEYEARLYNALDMMTMAKKTIIGHIIKISGKYDYYPDDVRSYGFRFYNEYMSGLDYENTFNAAVNYKRYWGNLEAGGTFNVNFESGATGGLIFGPMLHGLYKKYLGSAKLVGGAFGSYSLCTMKYFSGAGRHFLSYGLIGGFGMPISRRVAGSADVYLSHEFFVGSIQIPYLLTNNIQLVGGFKKAFVFKDWNLSNYIFTIGASRRF